jgi:hypothetical protein
MRRVGMKGSGGVAFAIVMVAVVSFFGFYAFAPAGLVVPGESGTAFFSSLVTGQPAANPTTTSTTDELETGNSSFVLQWNLAYFDTPTVPGCAAGPTPSGPWTPVPCNGPRADAIVFNCAAQAASPQGCIQTLFAKNSTTGVGFVVWCPYSGTTRPDGPYLLNASWNEFKTTMPSNPPNAVCVKLNSTAFLLAEPHNNVPA